MLVGALVLVALVATVTWFVAGGNAGDPVTVRLEPRSEPGPDAFTGSFATVEDGLVAGFTTLGADDESTGSGSGVELTRVIGDRSGLYGSLAAGGVCDTAGLADELTADTDRAAAFAAVLGVEVADVARVIAGLAPVVLGRDTAVTNHRFRDGRAEPFQAVLQAGTAVLVDARGVPRVRCACGNPLDPPAVEGRTVEVRGERWTGFSESRISLVAASEAPVTMIEAVDVETSEPVAVPVEDVFGDEGPPPETVEYDGLLVSDDTGVHVVAEDGTRLTTVIDQPVRAAFDDGAGGIVYDLKWPEESTSSLPPSLDHARSWHLPAGAADPVPLIDTDDASLGWSVLRGAGTLAGRSVVAYAWMRHHPDADEVGRFEGDLVVRDIASGADRVLTPGAYGWELGTSDVTIAGNRVAYDDGYATNSWSVFDSDLTPIATPCDDVEYDVLAPCPLEGGAFLDDDTLIGLEWSPNLESLHLVAVDVSSGLLDRPGESLTGNIVGWAGTATIDAMDGRVVVSFVPRDGSGSIPAVVFDTTTDVLTELSISGEVRFLRAPLVRPATASEGEVDVTEPAPPDPTTTEPPAPPPTTTSLSEPPPISEPVDLEVWIESFLVALTSGQDLSEYARPDVIETLPDFDLAYTYWVSVVVDQTCNVGSSGAGGCEVLIHADGTGCCAGIWRVSYYDVDGRLWVDRMDGLGSAS